jgi:hypothetical protein
MDFLGLLGMICLIGALRDFVVKGVQGAKTTQHRRLMNIANTRGALEGMRDPDFWRIVLDTLAWRIPTFIIAWNGPIGILSGLAILCTLYGILLVFLGTILTAWLFTRGGKIAAYLFLAYSAVFAPANPFSTRIRALITTAVPALFLMEWLIARAFALGS